MLSTAVVGVSLPCVYTPMPKKPPKHTLAQRFGSALRRLRVDRTGLSQDRFAGKAEIDRSYYGRLERGDANPTLETLDKLVKTLGVTYAIFGAAIDAER